MPSTLHLPVERDGLHVYTGDVLRTALRVPIAFSQRMHRPGRETAQRQWGSAGTKSEGCPGKFPGRSSTSAINKTMSFDDCAMATPSHFAPRHHICLGLRAPSCCEMLSETTAFTPALGDEICAGMLARRMGSTKLWCAILVTTARGVQGACPARRPAAALLAATGNLDGICRAPPWASSLARNYFCDRPNGVFSMGR
jgi:hypothetical protein